MPQVDVFNRTFLHGLQTTVDGNAASAFSGFRQFHNGRVGEDKFQRRPGVVLLGALANVAGSISFDGVDDVCYGPLPPDFDLDGNWFLELGVDPLALAGSVFLVGANSVLDLRIQGGNWRLAGLYDPAGSFTIVGPVATTDETYLAVLSLDGDISLIVNGVVAGTVAKTANFLPPTLYLGAWTLALGVGYNGLADNYRILRSAPASYDGRLKRLLNPRADEVLLDLSGLPPGATVMYDRSRHESHFLVVGSPSVLSPPVGGEFCPVQGMQIFMDENDRTRLAIYAGGSEYEGEI